MKQAQDVGALAVVVFVNGLGLAALALVGLFSRVGERPAPAEGWVLGPVASDAEEQGRFRVGETRSSTSLFSKQAYPLSLLEAEEERALARYGKQLIEETFLYLGPEVPDVSMRYAGNELSCKNCHLEGGLKAFAAPYVGVTKRFPSFGGRENRVGSIEDRVNGCMQRSLNGRPLPKDGREMKAIATYMKLLGTHVADEPPEGVGFVKVDFPARGVDLGRGERVYRESCASCHGADGRGRERGDGRGYDYPPLAGPDSYNTGAGMHRVLTSMAFIKGNMPLGATAENPFLSDEDAYDVAGYINSLERPVKARLEDDYPDRKLKPLSTPYPPYADEFPEVQHKYGPFGPLRDYYRDQYGLKKSK